MRESEEAVVSYLVHTINETATALAGAAVEAVKRKTLQSGSGTEWTGVGVDWVRRGLGAREWRVPCLDVVIRL